MLPGAFVLMAEKSKESYKSVLDELKSAAIELNLELKVTYQIFKLILSYFFKKSNFFI